VREASLVSMRSQAILEAPGYEFRPPSRTMYGYHGLSTPPAKHSPTRSMAQMEMERHHEHDGEEERGDLQGTSQHHEHEEHHQHEEQH